MKRKTIETATPTYEKSLNVDGTLAGAVTPESVLDLNQEVLASHDTTDLHNRLVDVPGVEQEKTKEFTNVNKEFNDLDTFADSLAGRIIDESIPKTIELFDPNELYAQDLASSIVQQAVENVVSYMDDREKSIKEKTEATRLSEPLPDQQDTVDGMKPCENQGEDMPVAVKQVTAAPQPEVDKDTRQRDTVKPTVTGNPVTEVDLSILDKYKK